MPEDQGRGDLQLPPGVFLGQRQDPGPSLVSAYRIVQGQIVRDGDWLERAVWMLGFAWPFVVALFAIMLTVGAGIALSDPFAYLLLLCSFLGMPLVIACFYRWLPASWPYSRLLPAVLLAVPC